MANSTEEPTTLTGALRFIGGVAGFVWGSTIGTEDPEIGFWIGGFIGMGMGAVAGWIVGKTLEVVFQIVFLLVGLALVAFRIYNMFNAVAG